MRGWARACVTCNITWLRACVARVRGWCADGCVECVHEGEGGTRQGEEATFCISCLVSSSLLSLLSVAVMPPRFCHSVSIPQLTGVWSPLSQNRQ